MIMTISGRVYILNDNFTEPSYMIGIGSIYMSSESNVWKLDQDLNVSMQYNTNAAYRGLYSNSTNGSLYLALEILF